MFWRLRHGLGDHAVSLRLRLAAPRAPLRLRLLEWGFLLALHKHVSSLGRRMTQVSLSGERDFLYARASRRIRLESRKKPMPTASGMTPKAAATKASGSVRAISTKAMV